MLDSAATTVIYQLTLKDGSTLNAKSAFSLMADSTKGQVGQAFIGEGATVCMQFSLKPSHVKYNAVLNTHRSLEATL